MLVQTCIEWHCVSQEETSMTYDMFFASIFELADVWVPAIDPDAYALFIKKVLKPFWSGAHLTVSLSCSYLINTTDVNAQIRTRVTFTTDTKIQEVMEGDPHQFA